jgi:geranylgeranyl pyrophosphate synthase
LSAALAGAETGVRKALETFGEDFGTAYQIVDDCLDLLDSDKSKDSCKDLEGGKVTLPLIKTVAALGREERRKFVVSFKEGKVERCREIILSSGAVAESMAVAERKMASASDSLSVLPDSSARRELKASIDMVLERARRALC